MDFKDKAFKLQITFGLVHMAIGFLIFLFLLYKEAKDFRLLLTSEKRDIV
jgi:hypothetical protein